jgi:hypothetical protein
MESLRRSMATIAMLVAVNSRDALERLVLNLMCLRMGLIWSLAIDVIVPILREALVTGDLAVLLQRRRSSLSLDLGGFVYAHLGLG